MVKIGDAEHAVTIDDRRRITVDGEEMDIALEFTPGDRVEVAEIGERTRGEGRQDASAGFQLTTRGRLAQGAGTARACRAVRRSI